MKVLTGFFWREGHYVAPSFFRFECRPSGSQDMGLSKDLITVDLRSSRLWRAWLKKHHASSPGVWLVYHKAHSGVKSIEYEDSVREALCFAWIDSLIKRLDEDRYARKFTPRNPASKWSDSNRKRWRELNALGLLAAAGRASAPTGKRYSAAPKIPDKIPAYITKALKTNSKAWSYFQKLSPSHRREFLMWIHSAKRPKTRKKRIGESIEMLSAGKKLGLR